MPNPQRGRAAAELIHCNVNVFYVNVFYVSVGHLGLKGGDWTPSGNGPQFFPSHPGNDVDPDCKPLGTAGNQGLYLLTEEAATDA